MNIEKKVAWIAGVLGIISFLDQYILKSVLLKRLSIPESIPTSIFILLLFSLVLVVIFISKKKINIPYRDQRKEVEGLNRKVDELNKKENKTNDLLNENEKLKKSIDSLKKTINGEKALGEKIYGILSQGSTEVSKLRRELRISSDDQNSLDVFQIVLGKLTREGVLTTNILGHYEIAKT